MKAKSVLVAALTAGVAVGVSGCGSASSNQAGTPTSVVSSTGRAAQPTQGRQPAQWTQPVPGGQTGQPSGDDSNSPVTVPDTTTQTVAPQQPTVIPVTTNPAPNGSGHGLCFDLNSGLANSAISGLAVPSTGPWNNPSASNDPLSAGCDGVLSWMTVESGNTHPYTQVLFFTNGTYLGTATAKPYSHTEVIGKTTNTVSVRYRWAKPDDALCCPTGGPSVVTFTFSGGKIHADGQFPPND